MNKPTPANALVTQAPLSTRLPSHKLVRYDRIATCDSAEIETIKVGEIASLIWTPPSLTPAEHDALVVKAIDLFESFEPSDGIEGMLAVHMVGTHNAIVECLRRAMLPEQSVEAQKMYWSQGERMMGLYTRHLDALNRHRGKGQANISVGQVNVESGGQAIVGSVDAGQRSPVPVETPLALEKPDTALPVTDFGIVSRSKVHR